MHTAINRDINKLCNHGDQLLLPLEHASCQNRSRMAPNCHKRILTQQQFPSCMWCSPEVPFKTSCSLVPCHATDKCAPTLWPLIESHCKVTAVCWEGMFNWEPNNHSSTVEKERRSGHLPGFETARASHRPYSHLTPMSLTFLVSKRRMMLYSNVWFLKVKMK